MADTQHSGVVGLPEELLKIIEEKAETSADPPERASTTLPANELVKPEATKTVG